MNVIYCGKPVVTLTDWAAVLTLTSHAQQCDTISLKRQMKQRFYLCKIICYPGLKLAMNQTISHWSYRGTGPRGAERKATVSHRLIANKIFCALKARVSLCSDTGCGGTKRETLADFKVSENLQHNGTAKAQYAGPAFKWEGTDFAATGLQHQSHGWWIVTNYFYIFMRILTYSSSSPQAHSFQMYLCQTHSLPCCPSACEQSSVPHWITRNKRISYFLSDIKQCNFPHLKTPLSNMYEKCNC